MSSADLPRLRRSTAVSKLPDYDHPPLVQVELAVQFEDPVLLDAEQQRRWEQELGPAWVRSEASDGQAGFDGWTTRVQDQRVGLVGPQFLYQWDGQTGDRYPHYPLVREGFAAVWNAWCTAIGPARPLAAWKVNYLNRIPKGTVWTSLADCSFLRLLAPLPSLDGLSAPRATHHDWMFSLDRFAATLTVSLEAQVDPSSETDTLWLHLQSEGRLTEPDETFLAGFDYGREVIVRTFRQLMQPAANEFWGLKA